MGEMLQTTSERNDGVKFATQKKQLNAYRKLIPNARQASDWESENLVQIFVIKSFKILHFPKSRNCATKKYVL